MKLSQIQKENIRKSFLAYVAGIPVENASDLEKIKEILDAIQKNKLDQVSIPEEMQAASQRLNEYMQLFIEINRDFPESKTYFSELVTNVKQNIDNIIGKGEDEVAFYIRSQKEKLPKQAKHNPLMQVVIDTFNIHEGLRPLLQEYLGIERSKMIHGDDIASQTIPLFPIESLPTIIKPPLAISPHSLFYELEVEEDNKYAYRLSKIPGPYLDFNMYGYEFYSGNHFRQQLKILKTLVSHPEARELLFGASIRFENFLALGETAKDFASLLFIENKLGLRLYQQNILHEKKFEDWGFEKTANYLHILGMFDEHGLLDEGKSSKAFILSLSPDELSLLKAAIEDETISFKQLAEAKKEELDKFENLVRLDRFHPFTKLPSELQAEIFKILNLKDFIKLRKVSTSTKKLVDDLITRPENIAKLINEFNFTQLKKFIEAYASDPKFKTNFTTALESNPDLIRDFFTNLTVSQFFFLIDFADNLFEKQYSKINIRIDADLMRIAEEDNKKNELYLVQKTAYEEDDKRYAQELEEYKKLSKEYHSQGKKGPEPVAPQRKLNEPKKPQRQKLSLSAQEALQIALYALSASDIKKLDRSIVKLAMQHLPESYKHIKKSLERMITIIENPNVTINSLENTSFGFMQNFVFLNLRGYDGFKNKNFSTLKLFLFRYNLIGLNFENSNFEALTVSECLACGVNLKNANLSNTKLNGSDLSYADLTGTNLTNANLEKTNLTGVITDDATDFTGAKFFSNLPSDSELNSKYSEVHDNAKICLAMAQNIISIAVSYQQKGTQMFNTAKTPEELTQAKSLLYKAKHSLPGIKNHPLFKSSNEIQDLFSNYEKSLMEASTASRTLKS